MISDLFFFYLGSKCTLCESSYIRCQFSDFEDKIVFVLYTNVIFIYRYYKEIS